MSINAGEWMAVPGLPGLPPCSIVCGQTWWPYKRLWVQVPAKEDKKRI
jgi:hypothetical protein